MNTFLKENQGIQKVLMYLMINKYPYIQIIKMEPPSTVDNSNKWRLWHSLNYLFGGIGFIVGSVTLFPHLNHYFPAAIISAWFFTVGSFTFLLADIT